MIRAWLITSFKANKYKEQRYLTEAKRLGIKVEVLRAEELSLVLDGEAQKILYQNKIKRNLPDFVVSIVVGEKFYPQVPPLLRFLSDTVFTGNLLDSYKLANDKLSTYQLLSNLDIPYPKTIAGGIDYFSQLKSELEIPFVVKPNNGLKGEGVVLIHKEIEFQNYIDENEGEFFIAQKFLDASKGQDLRLLMLEGKLLGAIHRRASEGSFLSNSAQGSRAQVIDPPGELVEMAKTISKKMKLFFCSVDFIFDGKKYVVCEVNASPGFEQFESTTGINVASQVLEALARHR